TNRPTHSRGGLLLRHRLSPNDVLSTDPGQLQYAYTVLPLALPPLALPPLALPVAPAAPAASSPVAPDPASALTRQPATALLATTRRVPASAEPGQYAAVALFLQRARAVQAELLAEETPEQLGAIVALCQRLEGIPLAIELAAARTRFFSPQDLLARVERGMGGVLIDGARDLPERQHTMARAVAWSVALLEGGAQRFF